MKQKIRTLIVITTLMVAFGTNVYATEAGNGNKSGSTVETTTNAEGNSTTIITDKNGNSLVIEDLGENFDEDNIELEPDEETNEENDEESSTGNLSSSSGETVDETMDSVSKTEKAEEKDSDTAKKEKAEKSHNAMPPILVCAVVLMLVSILAIRLRKR